MGEDVEYDPMGITLLEWPMRTPPVVFSVFIQRFFRMVVVRPSALVDEIVAVPPSLLSVADEDVVVRKVFENRDGDEIASCDLLREAIFCAGLLPNFSLGVAAASASSSLVSEDTFSFAAPDVLIGPAIGTLASMLTRVPS